MGIAHGRVERFEDDQLVIALPDLELVTRTLADLDVYMGPADRHQGLGLARIRGLANLGAAVRALLAEDGVGTELGRFQGEREGLHPHGVADLDILLEGVRLRFARDYPGWQVTVGKNHRPSPLHGSPHIDGGNGDPEPAAAALPPLGSGPGSALGRGVRVGLLVRGRRGQRRDRGPHRAGAAAGPASTGGTARSRSGRRPRRHRA
jgi:hypothetical protein